LDAERLRDTKVEWTTLAMAAFATTALDQAMLEPGRSRALALAVSAGVLAIPVLVGGWILTGRHARAIGLGARLGRLSRGATANFSLLALFALPFACEAVRVILGGRPAMAEVTLMTALRNLGLGLAALAVRPVYGRLSALVSLFLVTVASSVGGEAGMAVLAAIGGFGVSGTLWLILVYWEGLGPAASAGARAGGLPISGAIWVLGGVAVLVAAAAIGPSRAATALVGLVPTSGGTDWSEPDARSGVGDGDNEVSASEHPQSVGFSESELYLETDRPSLYDSFNETYGEPLKPKKQEKMIALGPQDFGEQKERPAENLHAGREFSMVRRKPEARPRRPGERVAKALVYVKGPTPLHLPLTSYSHFDGVTWREEPCCDRRLPAVPEPSDTWLRLPWLEASFLAGTVVHQVKIGTLDSSPMPMPPHLMRFRVGSVNRLDFFGWAQFGIVRMTGRTVPAGTVIDSEARTVDPRRLRSHPFRPQSANALDHHLSFRDTYAINPVVALLAKSIVAGLPEGWCQVEAVIAALRQGYSHERSSAAPVGCTDAVADFLLRSREGPDYLFASSAAVLLRSLGYPTRVVSGLYAAPARYDPRTRHTPVTGEDVHFWAEVRMPDGLWVAVEPTPGYDLLPPVRPWFERIARVLAATGRWARAHTAGLLALVIGLIVLARRSHFLLDRLATISFGLFPETDSRRFVMRALQLVERRARWAGRARPPGLTLARWYCPVASEAASEPRIALEGLVWLADWATHAPDWPGMSAHPSTNEIQHTCRNAVSEWTLARLRAPIADRSGKEATT
jgi:protein-glutamine gamma-glutamyltransferase